MKSRTQYVIIGNSAGGRAALEAIRSRDKRNRVTMIADEDYPLYPRMFLPYIEQKDIKNSYPEPSYFEALQTETLFGDKVDTIDPVNARVICSNGRKVSYDKLLIATGASPRHLKMPGMDKKRIVNFWTMSDTRRIFEAMKNSKRVVIIGAGLIGALTIEAFFKKSKTMSVIEISDHVLPAILHEYSAEFVQKLLQKQGVRIYTGEKVLKIQKKNKGSSVVILSSGKELPFDAIIAGIGTIPNTEIIQGTGISCKKGIVVDSCMRTSVENIFAAGDVAEVPSLLDKGSVVVGTWSAAVEQGKIAGLNMTGADITYQGGFTYNILKLFDINIASAGIPEFKSNDGLNSTQNIYSDSKRGVYRWIGFNPDGSIRGAIAIGKIQDMGIIQSLIRNKTPLRDYYKHAYNLLTFPELLLKKTLSLRKGNILNLTLSLF